MTLAEIDVRIAELEELKFSGVESSSSDGIQTHFRSKEELDEALTELRRKRRKLLGKTRRHPYARPTFGGGS